MESEIKPCPFCGNKYVEVTEEWIAHGLHDGGYAWVVRCNYLKGGCGSKSGSRETKEKAINLWNLRAKEKLDTAESILIHRY